MLPQVTEPQVYQGQEVQQEQLAMPVAQDLLRMAVRLIFPEEPEEPEETMVGMVQQTDIIAEAILQVLPVVGHVVVREVVAEPALPALQDAFSEVRIVTAQLLVSQELRAVQVALVHLEQMALPV